jgi:hypothetical protein
MTRLQPIAALIALACGTLPAFAAAPEDAAALRAELQALKNDYDGRISSLEARIAELEASTAPRDASIPAAAGQAAPVAIPMPGAVGQSRSTAAAFNPSLSVILGGTYTNLSQNPGSWQMSGLIPSGGEVGPGERSFNLDESELTVAANVDPYFSAALTAAISAEDEIEVEEAYFRTLALPSGFTAKGGRFFSGLGYLNEVHAHAWDFVDQPLVYQAFFANQRAQDGVQLKWLAPAELFVELGAEAGNGEAFPGTRRDRNGLNATTLFAHVGGDVGDSASWRAGASWLDARAEERTYEDVDDLGTPVLNAFTGKSATWVVDAVFKWSPQGNTARQQLKIQGEYMRRKEDGDLTFDVEGQGLVGAYASEHAGWYLQSVFQFRPRWRVGLRYDALDSGTPDIALVQSGLLPAAAFPVLLPADPERISVMLDWNPTEFSRLRAQYAWDDARATGDQDRQLFLQYLFGIGAHGAHKF